MKPFRSARMRWVAEQQRKKFALGARITIKFSDEAQSLLDDVRRALDCSTSDAIDHLMLRLKPKVSVLKEVNGLMVFAFEDDGPPITLEDIQFAEDQEFAYLFTKLKPTPRRTSVRISQDTVVLLKGYRSAHDVTASEALCALILAAHTN